MPDGDLRQAPFGPADVQVGDAQGDADFRHDCGTDIEAVPLQLARQGLILVYCRRLCSSITKEVVGRHVMPLGFEIEKES